MSFHVISIIDLVCLVISHDPHRMASSQIATGATVAVSCSLGQAILHHPGQALYPHIPSARFPQLR